MTAPQQNHRSPQTVSQFSASKQSGAIPPPRSQSGEPKSPNPQWVQAFLLHAPLIGIGLGLTAGLCLLAGMSLSVILDPNANHPDNPSNPAAIESATESATENKSVTDSSENSPAKPSESQTSQSQTTVTPDGVRIVVPADQNFAGKITQTSQTPTIQASNPQSRVNQPTASVGLDSPRAVPQTSRLLLVLWSLGGICLVGAGISAWFSRRWNGQESIVSPELTAVSAPPGTLALRDPSTIVPVPNHPNLSIVQNLEPETIAPHSLPADPSRPFYGTLLLPEAPEPSPLTIEYDPIPDDPDLTPDDRRKERILDSDGDNMSLTPPDLITSDLETPDLASQMDIRKRRPRID